MSYTVSPDLMMISVQPRYCLCSASIFILLARVPDCFIKMYLLRWLSCQTPEVPNPPGLFQNT